MMIGARRSPWDQMGMEAAPMAMDVPQVAMPVAPMAPAKQKTPWMAILADALSGLAGQQGQYPQRVARERAEQTDFERGEQRYQRQRADAQTDWQRNKEWEQQNKAPYRFEDNAGNVREIGPDGQPRMLFQDPTPKERWVFDPVRGYVNINAGAPSAPPAEPVGELRPIGGAGPQTPPTFPRPYY